MTPLSPSHPLVSVMMPVYNAERYIRQAIDSVLAQTYTHWELIVIDDGSTDRSRELAAGYPDERIRVLHQANAGEAAARNHALAVMRGELLAFVDADDALLPDHLALAVAYLTAHPDREAVYTDGIHIDGEGRRLTPLSSRRRGPFEGWIFEQVVRASDVFGPPMCVVLRRGPIEAEGLQFDPAIVIGPDWDFFTHYSQNTRFGYLDRQTCLYRIHTTNISVQTDLRRRAGYLARCRTRAIGLPRFAECSLETRTAVFYDLLVNLLALQPEQQAAALAGPQFAALPPRGRARLLRLMATGAVLDGCEHALIAEWLRQAAALGDAPARALAGLRRLHPALMRGALRLRAGGRPPVRIPPPFGDLAGR